MQTSGWKQDLWPKAVGVAFIVTVFASLWISTADFGEDAPPPSTSAPKATGHS